MAGSLITTISIWWTIHLTTLSVWDSAGNRQSGMDISLGIGTWEGGFAYNNHFYLVDNSSDTLEVWDSSGVRQSGMDISLGIGTWQGGFAYNNHFYLVDNSSDTLEVWDSSGVRQSGMDISLGIGTWDRRVMLIYPKKPVDPPHPSMLHSLIQKGGLYYA